MPSRLRTSMISVILVTGALALHAGATAAANSVDDVLQQQRAVLGGRTALMPTPSGAPAGSWAARSVGDAQEAARALLGGTARTPTLPRPAASAAGGRLHGDAQGFARAVLLGRRDAAGS
jgi:hypothetical protein